MGFQTRLLAWVAVLIYLSLQEEVLVKYMKCRFRVVLSLFWGRAVMSFLVTIPSRLQISQSCNPCRLGVCTGSCRHGLDVDMMSCNSHRERESSKSDGASLFVSTFCDGASSSLLTPPGLGSLVWSFRTSC